MTLHTTNVLTKLRAMIMDGEIAPGEKLAEIPMADKLGVSRTPVRLAFRTLEQEGLLIRPGKRGFQVREFSTSDIQCALEIRGALEGIAARRLAEQGLDDTTLEKLREAVEAGNSLLQKGYFVEEDIEQWNIINVAFHNTIIDASNSAPVRDAIARNNHLPFASVNSLVINTKVLDAEFKKIQFAQVQHQAVLGALMKGEGARAENLMREHAQVALHYTDAFGLPAYKINHSI